ncbi:MAG: type II CAAX endopeptidase family protein [Acidimicrobiales bacterium]
MNDRPEQAVDAAGPGASPPPAVERGSSVRTFWRGDVPLGRQLDAGSAPCDRNAAWMWLLFAGLGFLGGQVLAAVFVGVAAELAGQLHSLTALSKLAEPPTWYVVSTLFGLWGGFLGAAVLASQMKGTRHFRTDLGLRFRWIDLIGIPIGVGGQYLIALMYVPIAPHVHDFHQRFSAPAQRLTGGSHGLDYIVIGVATVVGAPFFEELFFRGVLLRSLARLFGNWGGWVGPGLAIVISGVLFGLAHAESLQLLGLAVFGVILGTVSYRTGRLGMDMVAHASFNLVAIVAVVCPTILSLRGPV